MDDQTRRGFLIMAGAGAAAAAAGVTAIAATKHDNDDKPAATEAAGRPASGRLVAYVSDAGSGRVSVMVGETEVLVHDPELVARLSKHASGGKA